MSKKKNQFYDNLEIAVQVVAEGKEVTEPEKELSTFQKNLYDSMAKLSASKITKEQAENRIEELAESHGFSKASFSAFVKTYPTLKINREQ